MSFYRELAIAAVIVAALIGWVVLMGATGGAEMDIP